MKGMKASSAINVSGANGVAAESVGPKPKDVKKTQKTQKVKKLKKWPASKSEKAIPTKTEKAYWL